MPTAAGIPRIRIRAQVPSSSFGTSSDVSEYLRVVTAIQSG